MNKKTIEGLVLVGIFIGLLIISILFFIHFKEKYQESKQTTISLCVDGNGGVNLANIYCENETYDKQMLEFTNLMGFLIIISGFLLFITTTFLIIGETK